MGFTIFTFLLNFTSTRFSVWKAISHPPPPNLTHPSRKKNGIDSFFFVSFLNRQATWKVNAETLWDWTLLLTARQPFWSIDSPPNRGGRRRRMATAVEKKSNNRNPLGSKGYAGLPGIQNWSHWIARAPHFSKGDTTNKRAARTRQNKQRNRKQLTPHNRPLSKWLRCANKPLFRRRHRHWQWNGGCCPLFAFVAH